MSEKTSIRHKVMKQAIEKIQTKYGVYPNQISESSQPRFDLIGLGFYHEGLLSKEEIRQIVVGSKEILLHEMNSSEEFRPYLEELGRYPCGSREASIVLFIHDADGRTPFHPNICVADSNFNTVEYSTKSPSKQYGYFEETEEPYEVALAIVRGEAPDK